MTWTPPAKPVNWQDTPSTSTALDAANLNADEAYAATVGASVVSYFEGGSSSAVPAVNRFLTPSGGDDSAAMQTALTAGGVIVLSPGTFLWNTQVPGLVPSKPTRIQGSGVGATTIKLSSGAPRFLDLARTADYQTFNDIEVSDLTVDCNSIGGRHHVVLGTYIAGVVQVRMNMRGIRLRRVKTINVPVDSALTNHRLNVWLVPAVVNNSDTATSITDVRLEDCRFEGGNMGAVIGYANNSGVALGTPATVDDIHLLRCWHSLMSNPGSAFTSSNYQIGSGAQVGRVRMTDCYGAYSGDVGIEVDSATDFVARGCVMDDAQNIAFFKTNFNNPVNLNAQSFTYSECWARYINVASPAKGIGWSTFYQNSVALGDMSLINCRFYRNNGNATPGTSGDAIDLGAAVLRSLTIDRFIGVVEGVVYNSSSNISYTMMKFNPINNPPFPCLIKLRDVNLSIAGARSGSGVWNPMALISISGSSILDWDKLVLTTSLTGTNSTGNRLILLPSAGATTVRGTIKRAVFSTANSDDNSPRAFAIGGSSQLTVTGELRIEDCDFAGMTAGNEVFFADNTLAGKVVMKGNKWRVFPKLPTAITVGGSPFTYQNASGNAGAGAPTGGWTQTVLVTGGTVSDISLSADNATFFTTGQTAGSFRVEPGQWIKVTYTVAPTMTAMHER